MGLNDRFNVVKSQILLLGPLPPLNRVFTMVLQHERQNGLQPVEDSHVLINLAERKKPFGIGKPNNGGKHRKLGHTVDTCYKKYGFPPQLRTPNKMGEWRGSSCSSNLHLYYHFLAPLVLSFLYP